MPIKYRPPAPQLTFHKILHKTIEESS